MKKEQSRYNETKLAIMAALKWHGDKRDIYTSPFLSCQAIARITQTEKKFKALSAAQVRVSMSHYATFRHKYFDIMVFNKKPGEKGYSLNEYGAKILKDLQSKARWRKPLKL